jgi:hypothetical protein
MPNFAYRHQAMLASRFSLVFDGAVIVGGLGDVWPIAKKAP